MASIVQDKENRVPRGKLLHAIKTKPVRPKFSNGISTTNSSSIGTVLRDVKNSASRKLTVVFSALDNISERIYRTARKQYVQAEREYDELDNSTNKTPTKLYSPFSIVTPSPKKDLVAGGQKTVVKVFDFSSPTGKLRKDVEEMSEGLDDLSAAATALQKRIS